MDEKFNDLFEPIELLAPLDLGSEMGLAANGPVIKCNKGYVCNVGEVIP